MSLTITHKQGATFSHVGTVLLPAGDWSATCKARDRVDAIVATMVVTLEPLAEPTADASHSVRIFCVAANTLAWPVAKLDCDVRFADASDPPVVVPSDTFTLNVLKRISDA